MKSYKDIAGDGGSNIAAQVGEQVGRLNARMASVRHIVAVMSGKGGVGKSALTVNLASALALQGAEVGILDADINGSSIPKMTGLRGRSPERGPTGMIPPVNSLNTKVMSIDLLLKDDRSPVQWKAATQDDAYTWRAMMEVGAVREFLSDTDWGALDYLFIDLPPGTDRLPNLAGLLPRLSGAIIVTIPSGVSELVVGKSIRLAGDLKTPIVGLVENMSSYVCTHCGREEALFPGGNIERMADAEGIPYLGSIPFDSRIAAAADDGVLFMTRFGDTTAGEAIRRIARKMKRFLDGGTE